MCLAEVKDGLCIGVIRNSVIEIFSRIDAKEPVALVINVAICMGKYMAARSHELNIGIGNTNTGAKIGLIGVYIVLYAAVTCVAPMVGRFGFVHRREQADTDKGSGETDDKPVPKSFSHS